MSTVRHHQPGNYTATSMAYLQSNKTNFLKSNKKDRLITFLKDERKKINGEDLAVVPLDAGNI